VSPSQPEPVLQYIETEQEHHRIRTFQEEHRELLRRHGIDFDERAVHVGLKYRVALSALRHFSLFTNPGASPQARHETAPLALNNASR